MKYKYQIYVVKDSHGNKDARCVDDPSDTVQFFGLMNKEKESTSFESEAYHVKEWCEDEELELSILDVETDV